MRGFLVIFQSDGVEKRLNVGTDDSDKARKLLVSIYPNASNVVILPLKDGEGVELGLAEGEIREVL